MDSYTLFPVLFYSGIFEVVIHDMPMEEAKNYINELRAFYGNGWKEYYRK